MRVAAYLIALSLFFVLPVLAQSTAPESDVQVWADTTFTVPILKKEDNKTSKLSILFGGAVRYGGDYGRIVDERVFAGFEFRFNRYLTVAPTYIYRAGQPFRGRREWESRIRVDIGLEKQIGKFSLKDRNRLEHRFRNFREDSTRYRNKFQVSYPITSKKKEIFSIFVASEPFYEFQAKKWTRNELSGGIIRKFNRSVTGEFYYLLQNNIGTTFRYVNVFGMNFKIKLDR